jgi:hypothetical protein
LKPETVPVKARSFYNNNQKCSLLDFITVFLLKIVQEKSLKARMSTPAYLAFCYL